jgi:hypothetical protein
MIPMADMLNAGFEMGNVHLFGDGDEDNEVNRKALEGQGLDILCLPRGRSQKESRLYVRIVLPWR